MSRCACRCSCAGEPLVKPHRRRRWCLRGQQSEATAKLADNCRARIDEVHAFTDHGAYRGCQKRGSGCSPDIGIDPKLMQRCQLGVLPRSNTRGLSRSPPPDGSTQ